MKLPEQTFKRRLVVTPTTHEGFTKKLCEFIEKAQQMKRIGIKIQNGPDIDIL